MSGGCATDTAIAEMVRSLGEDYASSTVKTSDEVQNCSGQHEKRRRGMFPKGTDEQVWIEEVMDAAVEEDALQPST